jgi:hypothetical protein
MTQPIALRLAEWLDLGIDPYDKASAAELRRLHEENTALRQAIEQAEQWNPSDMAHRLGGLSVEQKPWGGLTDEEMTKIASKTLTFKQFVEIIEAKLKERNT